MTSPRTHWQALDRATLCLRQWPGEDEGVVFNCASGDLHLLNQTALEVLEHLFDTPSTPDDLAASFEVDRAALDALIQSLDEIGLVHPIDS